MKNFDIKGWRFNRLIMEEDINEKSEDKMFLKLKMKQAFLEGWKSAQLTTKQTDVKAFEKFWKTQKIKESVNEGKFNYMKDSDSVRDLFKIITGKSGDDDLDSASFSGGWVLNVDDSNLNSAMAAKFVKAVMALGKKKGWKIQQYGDDAIEIFESVNKSKKTQYITDQESADRIVLLFLKQGRTKEWIKNNLGRNRTELKFIGRALKAVKESVNEAKEYYVTYNRGRGQGKGLINISDTNNPKIFKSYKDAEKWVKRMSGGPSMTAFWVSDKDMNRIEK